MASRVLLQVGLPGGGLGFGYDIAKDDTSTISHKVNKPLWQRSTYKRNVSTKCASKDERLASPTIIAHIIEVDLWHDGRTISGNVVRFSLQDFAQTFIRGDDLGFMLRRDQRALDLGKSLVEQWYPWKYRSIWTWVSWLYWSWQLTSCDIHRVFDPGLLRASFCG